MRVPLSASAPDHAPPATQLDALVEDHVSVMLAPSRIELAVVVSVTVGLGTGVALAGGGVCASRHAAGHKNSILRKNIMYPMIANWLVGPVVSASGAGDLATGGAYVAGSTTADIDPVDLGRRQSAP